MNHGSDDYYDLPRNTQLFKPIHAQKGGGDLLLVLYCPVVHPLFPSSPLPKAVHDGCMY